jgi:hypothetical protein
MMYDVRVVMRKDHRVSDLSCSETILIVPIYTTSASRGFPRSSTHHRASNVKIENDLDVRDSLIQSRMERDTSQTSSNSNVLAVPYDVQYIMFAIFEGGHDNFNSLTMPMPLLQSNTNGKSNQIKIRDLLLRRAVRTLLTHHRIHSPEPFRSSSHHSLAATLSWTFFTALTPTARLFRSRLRS